MRPPGIVGGKMRPPRYVAGDEAAMRPPRYVAGGDAAMMVCSTVSTGFETRSERCQRMLGCTRAMAPSTAQSAPCTLLPGWPSHTVSRLAFGRVESAPSAVVCLTGGMMFGGARCAALPLETSPRSRRDASSCLRAGGNLDGDDEIHAALRVFWLAAVAAALGAVIFAGAGDALPASLDRNLDRSVCAPPYRHW